MAKFLVKKNGQTLASSFVYFFIFATPMFTEKLSASAGGELGTSGYKASTLTT